MTSLHILVGTSLVLMTLLQVVFTIQCYRCSSSSYGDCGDSDTVSTIPPTNCEDPNQVCVKLVTKKPNVDIIRRECALPSICTLISTYTSCEICTADLCNKSTSILLSWYSLVGILLSITIVHFL